MPQETPATETDSRLARIGEDVAELKGEVRQIDKRLSSLELGQQELRKSMEQSYQDLRKSMEQSYQDLRKSMEQGNQDLRKSMEQGNQELRASGEQSRQDLHRDIRQVLYLVIVGILIPILLQVVKQIAP